MKHRPKSYRFTVTVKTFRPKTSARMAILSAFAQRSPDGCEFRVTEQRTPKAYKPHE
jgi:hypothetical protein